MEEYGLNQNPEKDQLSTLPYPQINNLIVF